MGAVLVAVEKLTNLLNRCELYESLHVRNTASPTKGQANLAVALVELYAAILDFLADCRDYLTQNTAGMILSPPFRSGCLEAYGNHPSAVDVNCTGHRDD